MTLEEKIIAGDKLICVFMGYEFNEKDKRYRIPKNLPQFKGSDVSEWADFDNEYILFSAGNLKYHSSYDWLIPVKQKAIETGHCSIVMNNYDVSLTTYSRPHESDGFCKLYFHTSPNGNNWTEIQALWNALVEFIEWHNQTI